jgi:hypothetical protein
MFNKEFLLSNVMPNPGQLMTQVDQFPVMRHPYGFYVLQTGTEHGGIPIRFHAWVPNRRITQQPCWPPHSHRSDMLSHVLSGTLVNAQWERWKIGHGKPLYTVSIEGNRSFMRRSTIHADLGEPMLLSVPVGGSYTVPGGVFHDSRVDQSDHCLTLCLFSNDRKGQSIVVGEHGFPDEVESHRLAFAPDEAVAARHWCKQGLIDYIDRMSR